MGAICSKSSAIFGTTADCNSVAIHYKRPLTEADFRFLLHKLLTIDDYSYLAIAQWLDIGDLLALQQVAPSMSRRVTQALQERDRFALPDWMWKKVVDTNGHLFSRTIIRFSRSKLKCAEIHFGPHCVWLPAFYIRPYAIFNHLDRLEFVFSRQVRVIVSRNCTADGVSNPSMAHISGANFFVYCQWQQDEREYGNTLYPCALSSESFVKIILCYFMWRRKYFVTYSSV